MPDNHALAQRDEITWQDLLETPLITLQGPFLEQVTAELDDSISAHVQQARYKVNFMSTALEMTRQGFGITLCLPYMPEVIDWVSANGLLMRPLTQPVKMRQFFYLSTCFTGVSPATIAFKQFLQTYFTTHYNDLHHSDSSSSE
nr:LysR substrate-binding domain-containing protein [Psychrobacter sp. JCM 18900]